MPPSLREAVVERRSLRTDIRSGVPPQVRLIYGSASPRRELLPRVPQRSLIHDRYQLRPLSEDVPRGAGWLHRRSYCVLGGRLRVESGLASLGCLPSATGSRAESRRLSGPPIHSLEDFSPPRCSRWPEKTISPASVVCLLQSPPRLFRLGCCCRSGSEMAFENCLGAPPPRDALHARVGSDEVCRRTNKRNPQTSVSVRRPSWKSGAFSGCLATSVWRGNEILGNVQSSSTGTKSRDRLARGHQRVIQPETSETSSWSQQFRNVNFSSDHMGLRKTMIDDRRHSTDRFRKLADDASCGSTRV